MRICPVCGEKSDCIHKGVRDNKDIDVYKCEKCGTKFLSGQVKSDYENGFMYQSDGVFEVDIPAVLKECQSDDERRYVMVKDLCENKKLADFGCGYGGFLSRISKVTSSSIGIELGRDERNYLKSQGINCIKAFEESGRKYDIITLFHCFEHLNAPQYWLNVFYDYLEDGGMLIIEVPNANDALLELYKNVKFADFTYWSAHLFLYTVKSLTMVIESTGKYDILEKKQVQRFPLANHLMWLAKGEPGGQHKWEFMCDSSLDEEYYKKLQGLEMCDTLFFILKKRNK